MKQIHSSPDTTIWDQKKARRTSSGIIRNEIQKPKEDSIVGMAANNGAMAGSIVTAANAVCAKKTISVNQNILLGAEGKFAWSVSGVRGTKTAQCC